MRIDLTEARVQVIAVAIADQPNDIHQTYPNFILPGLVPKPPCQMEEAMQVKERSQDGRTTKTGPARGVPFESTIAFVFRHEHRSSMPIHSTLSLELKTERIR